MNLPIREFCVLICVIGGKLINPQITQILLQIIAEKSFTIDGQLLLSDSNCSTCS